ncbi:hypothetical protein M3223_02525 [Paenibacillus pasadenensis]|uniref:hypothetical protein n=1 Tax=Paenibacillus pasadenensis TaxID=217090 RepID=UPI00203FC346|nr:hypothetical protein [Paenibacillus pasadenensis]MCM3746225.1 hypothetical protein [Paenibacillus pasadenensis]
MQTEWEKKSAEEIAADNKKSSLNILSLISICLPILGFLLMFAGNSFIYLLIGIGFGGVVYGLEKVVKTINDYQHIINRNSEE